MILINLLPPELRRARRTGVNPLMVAGAGGVVIVLALAGFWAWVKYARVADADVKIAALKVDLDLATSRANAVRELDKQIANFEKLHGTITNLITHKVLWARTLDDFANLLWAKNENHWNLEGYEVRCTGLTIAPATGSSGSRRQSTTGEMVTYTFRTSFKILGEQRDRAGDYVSDFFKCVEASRFWRDNGFQGNAEDPFKGATPNWKHDIKKVATDLPMEWTRIKIIPGPQGAQK
ncbi:MAG: hypothetical protein AAB263_04930 [Planctomycetota bacterium]